MLLPEPDFPTTPTDSPLYILKFRFLSTGLSVFKYLKDIFKFIKKNNGGLLIIDYGYFDKKMKDTLQAIYRKRYSKVSKGPIQWQKIKTEKSSIYNWDEGSTYVKKPPFFDNLSDEPEGFKKIKDARPLLILGDMVTTDHISPAGSIPKEIPTSSASI